MRVTLVIPDLGSGGAERVLATMANYWARRGWAVSVLTFDDGRQRPFYPLDPAIEHRPLDLRRDSASPGAGVRNNLHRVRVLRHAIAGARPDVVISFMDRTNVLLLLATLGMSVPVVVAEHNDPAQQPIGRGWRELRLALYPRAAAVVVLSETAGAYFPAAIRGRVRVVPNPVVVDVAATSAEARPATPERVLIAVGRLSDQKGFDLLLTAFAAVQAAHPEWRLEIWGDGELRGQLERQRDDLGLADRVRLPGRTESLHQRLAQADLFVLSSRYEGFPMALCEAMAVGLPVVSFDCPSGPREIVRHGVDGVLVPPGDVPALAQALDRLMGDAEERSRLAARAPEVLERFGVGRVMAIWDQILDEVKP